MMAKGKKKNITLYVDAHIYDEFLRNCREVLHMRPSNLVEVFMVALNEQVQGKDPVQPVIDGLMDYLFPKPKRGRPKKEPEPKE